MKNKQQKKEYKLQQFREQAGDKTPDLDEQETTLLPKPDIPALNLNDSQSPPMSDPNISALLGDGDTEQE